MNCSTRRATSASARGGLSTFVADISKTASPEKGTGKASVSSPVATCTAACSIASWPLCRGLKLPGRMREPGGMCGFTMVPVPSTPGVNSMLPTPASPCSSRGRDSTAASTSSATWPCSGKPDTSRAPAADVHRCMSTSQHVRWSQEAAPSSGTKRESASRARARADVTASSSARSAGAKCTARDRTPRSLAVAMKARWGPCLPGAARDAVMPTPHSRGKS